MNQWPGRIASFSLRIVGIMIAALPSLAAEGVNDTDIIHVHGRDLQQVLDAAPSNSVVRCDPNRLLTFSVPVTIRKPLTLVGLYARLPDKLGSTPLVVVEAAGTAIYDFHLIGNLDSVSQDVRAPLLIIRAGDFRVERGRLRNSSKDGIMIDGEGPKGQDLQGGVVRDIVGYGISRDVVSIGGGGSNGHIRNVLVDNVRCYNSPRRGAVEVSDGTDNITVRKVYAEGSIYAVDVQDHKKAGQSNRNVVIEDIYAVRCKHALRTENSRQGHGNLTVRDITAEQCTLPVQISNTDNVTLSNVRVMNHTSGQPTVHLRDCSGVTVRDVLVENASVRGAAVLLENCDESFVDGFTLRGRTNSVGSAVCFRITNKQNFTGLRISNVSARETTETGIVLERTGKEKGTLTDYIITGNLATVLDHLHGDRAMVTNNLP